MGAVGVLLVAMLSAAPAGVQSVADADRLVETVQYSSDDARIEQVLRRAIGIYQKRAPSGPGMLTASRRLGMTLLKQGRNAEAEPLLRTAWTIQEKSPYGEDAAETVQHLAGLVEERGAYSEAEVLYRRLVGIRETILGEEHSQTAAALQRLAWVLDQQDRFEEAEVYLRRALANDERKGRRSSIDSSERQRLLIQVLTATGKLDEAGARLAKLIEQTRDYRDERALRSRIFNTAGVLHDRLKNDAAAEEAFRSAQAHAEAVRLTERHLKDDLLSTIVGNIGVMLWRQNRLEEAEGHFRRALWLAEQKHGGSSFRLSRDLDRLGGVIAERGRLTDAEAAYRRSLAIKEKSLGPEASGTADTWFDLGGVLLQQTRKADALAAFARALAIREKVLGANHPRTVEARDALAKVR